MPAHLPDAALPDSPPARQPAALRRVIVIEDSEVDFELLKMRLSASYTSLEEVRWIYDPGSIIGQIAQWQPDLVISDFHMPGYDVIATLGELRRRWPALPVLVMSGLVGEEAAVGLLKAGANDFLPKSRPERLPMVIDRELADAHQKRTHARLQAELESQRRVNSAIIEQVPAGLWIMSADGVIERGNRHGEQMMGGPCNFDTAGPAAITGWWVDSGLPIGAHDWPGARAIEHRQLVPPRLMRVRTPRGEERYFSCGATPLTGDDGSSLGAVISAVDLTAEILLSERLRLAEMRLRELSASQSALHEAHMAAVSRELHDNLGQVLSLLKLHLGSAAHPDATPERRALELQEALPLVDMALARLRELCTDLRPSELSDFGLGPALSALCATAARASGINAAFTEAGAPRGLDAGVQHGLFRVAQQAVTNVLRHAHAANLGVHLEWLPAALELRIFDDGNGFDAAAPLRSDQHGLRNMRERMELLQGTLDLASTPGQGSILRAGVSAPPARGGAA